MNDSKNQLSLTESSDFAYLLTLLVPLYDDPAFSWLPELFAIIGHEDLIKLCKYAGGETIKIPTLTQLSTSIEALEWFYKVYISKKNYKKSIPEELRPLVDKILAHYGEALNSK